MKNVVDIIYSFQKYNHSCSKIEIMNVTKKSIKSIENALFMLDLLKIIEANKDNLKLIAYYLSKINSKTSHDQAICDNILLFPPFNEYIYQKTIGKSDEDAGLLVKHIFDINSEENKIISIFNSWIRYFNITLSLVPEDSQIASFVNYINQENGILLFIRQMLTHDISKIEPAILLDIKEGLSLAKEKPADALTDMGRALENFLRVNFKEVDLSKKNGIGEIAQGLRNEKRIPSKITNILLGLASIRTIGDAHGIDKDEGKSWHIEPITPVLFAALVLKTIDSIIAYQEEKLLF